MRKIVIILILLIFPINVFAYSDKLIVTGDVVGIEVNSSGVYIVDFYKVDGDYIAKKDGFKVGDIIIKVNDKKVNNVDELNSIINKPDIYHLTILRDNKEISKDLSVRKQNNIITTGLYVKDKITGIGTLSYIDPKTKIFASLGHDIIENASNDSFKMKDGSIYEANINSINN